jgi:hypothetical protein
MLIWPEASNPKRVRIKGHLFLPRGSCARSGDEEVAVVELSARNVLQRDRVDLKLLSLVIFNARYRGVSPLCWWLCFPYFQ